MSDTDQHIAASNNAASNNATSNNATRLRGLRGNSFAAVVMLLIEYGLGTWVNLYVTVPASDQGKGSFAAFARSVANGPAVLAIHALLGTLLLVTAATAVVRATLLRTWTLIVIASVALAAVVGAWYSGTKFVSDNSAGASLGMALAAGVAIMGYATILFLSSSIERIEQ